MKLYTSPPSPFVRKVRVLAHELGLADRLVLEDVALSPVAPDAALIAKNPLGKIPALELDDGTTLFDSRVICEYLASIAPNEAIAPSAGPARFAALRLEAAADGALDAGLLMRYELLLRPEERRFEDWIAAQGDKVLRTLAWIEGEVPRFGAALDRGQIAVACMLGWLAFRKPLLEHPVTPRELRQAAPIAMAWFDKVSERPSLRATEPR